MDDKFPLSADVTRCVFWHARLTVTWGEGYEWWVGPKTIEKRKATPVEAYVDFDQVLAEHGLSIDDI